MLPINERLYVNHQDLRLPSAYFQYLTKAFLIESSASHLMIGAMKLELLRFRLAYIHTRTPFKRTSIKECKHSLSLRKQVSILQAFSWSSCLCFDSFCLFCSRKKRKFLCMIICEFMLSQSKGCKPGGFEAKPKHNKVANSAEELAWALACLSSSEQLVSGDPVRKEEIRLWPSRKKRDLNQWEEENRRMLIQSQCPWSWNYRNHGKAPSCLSKSRFSIPLILSCRALSQ